MSRSPRSPPLRAAFAFVFAAASVGSALVATTSVTACDLADSDAGGPCGGATCTDKQVCSYRECNDTEKCRVSTQCAQGETPAACAGGPGCIRASCGPIVQGCRDIPLMCNGDIGCACQTLCGTVAACKQSDIAEHNILCAGS